MFQFRFRTITECTTAMVSCCSAATGSLVSNCVHCSSPPTMPGLYVTLKTFPFICRRAEGGGILPLNQKSQPLLKFTVANDCGRHHILKLDRQPPKSRLQSIAIDCQRFKQAGSADTFRGVAGYLILNPISEKTQKLFDLCNL